MKFLTKKIIKLLILLVLVSLGTLWAVRAYDAWRSPPPQLWHTFVPRELSIAEMDKADWGEYLARENALFDDVRREVTDKLPLQARTQSNRYYAGSRIYPPGLSHDWNRSYLFEPSGEVVGSVVLLHGLTDTPYSLRHVAKLYTDNGFVAVGIRLPAHGTVPGALSTVTWEEWMAATRLAVREARRRIPADRPLHIVGFSNGGALAMKYALDALEDSTLARPDRVILISPMIGVTRFARFAGLAAVPAFFPPFAKSAWLGIVPEFNPFKYNSFPVNGARQSHRLTSALQQQINRLSQEDVFNRLPPVLTFQSIMDYTVSTAAILQALYAQLPENGSELVLYDINRASNFGPLINAAAEAKLSRLLPVVPQDYDLTIVGNTAPGESETVARRVKAGEQNEEVERLNITYPRNVFSLSHVAIPFPMDDPLYGMTPPKGSEEQYGVNLGTLTARGERGTLILRLDSLFRTSSNPFHDYQMRRILSAVKDPRPKHHLMGPIKKKPAPDWSKEDQEFLDEEEVGLESAPF